MAQNVNAGPFAYANYGFESSYGTEAASFPRDFGHGTTLSISRKNNMERVFGLGARNASANVAKKYEGNVSIEFTLDAEGAWWRAVLGSAPTDAAVDSVYTHTYVESNTLASFSIENGQEMGTNDYVSKLIGCKVNSCNITTAVDEIAKVKLECPYRTETLATSGISSQVAPTGTPLTFALGTLTVAGTTVGYVQSVDLTITNNVEMVWGLGSRYSTAGPAKTRTYDFKLSVAFSDVTLLMEKFFGDTAPIDEDDLQLVNPAGVALVLTFSNGLATTDANARSIVMTFANFYLDEHNLPLNVDEVTKEDISGWALSCTSIVVTNATASQDDTP